MDSGSNSVTKISDANLYTDFSGLQKLRSEVSNTDNTDESIAGKREATKEVAKQFESIFLQMMLKTMRDATITGDSAETDQTKFYQEMFDKQIALDLANKSGGGLGIASMLEQDLGVVKPQASGDKSSSVQPSSINQVEHIRNQINHSGSVIFQSELNKTSSDHE